MIKLSKTKHTLKLDKVKYKLTQWSTIGTLLTGREVGLALGPSITVIADLMVGKSKEVETLDTLIDGENPDYMFTAAISALNDNFSDELFEKLHDKLFAGLEYCKLDEDGNEAGDFIKVEDWSDHLDEYPSHYEDLLVKSIKVNLYSFFMEQATVRMAIETVMTAASPLITKLNNSLKEG